MIFHEYDRVKIIATPESLEAQGIDIDFIGCEFEVVIPCEYELNGHPCTRIKNLIDHIDDPVERNLKRRIYAIYSHELELTNNQLVDKNDVITFISNIKKEVQSTSSGSYHENVAKGIDIVIKMLKNHQFPKSSSSIFAKDE